MEPFHKGNWFSLLLLLLLRDLFLLQLLKGHFPHSQPSLVRWPTARPRSNTTSRIDGHGQEVSRWRLVVLSWKSQIDGSLCGSLPSRKSPPYLEYWIYFDAEATSGINPCTGTRRTSIWEETPIHEVCWSRGTGRYGCSGAVGSPTNLLNQLDFETKTFSPLSFPLIRNFDRALNYLRNNNSIPTSFCAAESNHRNESAVPNDWMNRKQGNAGR